MEAFVFFIFVLVICVRGRIIDVQGKLERLEQQVTHLSRGEASPDAKRERMVRCQLADAMGTRCTLQYTTGIEGDATPLDMDDAWVLVHAHERGMFRTPADNQALVRIATIQSVRSHAADAKMPHGAPRLHTPDSMNQRGDVSA